MKAAINMKTAIPDALARPLDLNQAASIWVKATIHSTLKLEAVKVRRH